MGALLRPKGLCQTSCCKNHPTSLFSWFWGNTPKEQKTAKVSKVRFFLMVSQIISPSLWSSILTFLPSATWSTRETLDISKLALPSRFTAAATAAAERAEHSSPGQVINPLGHLSAWFHLVHTNPIDPHRKWEIWPSEGVCVGGGLSFTKYTKLILQNIVYCLSKSWNHFGFALRKAKRRVTLVGKEYLLRLLFFIS